LGVFLKKKGNKKKNKTHYKVYQNAGQFAPKRKAICTKTQGILHQNAR